MALNIEVKTKDQENNVKYPCLMTIKGIGGNDSTIVLFTKESSGIIIQGHGEWKGLEFSTEEEDCEDWNMDVFVPFNGQVILENK